jgi:protein TonB
MREAPHPHLKSAPALAPALSHCLMDNDAESLRLARRSRGCSMLLSTAIQVALLTAAAVVPLLATNETITTRILGPGPILHRQPPPPAPPQQTIVSRSGPSRGAARSLHPVRPITEPRIIPTDVAMVDESALAPPHMTGATPGGPGVPGGVGNPNLFGHVLPPPLPPVDTKPRTVRVSPSIQAAKLIYKVEPRYPALAIQTRREGQVELRAVIAREGTVQNLEVVSGHPLFIEATLQAVRQWRYQPTLLGGEAVEVQTHITVIFRLNRN